MNQRRDEEKRLFAIEVVHKLRAAGYIALWAGGCVRDLLLGKPADDYDVATNATPRQVIRLFPHTVPVGVSFGVVRIIGGQEKQDIEVATFRSEGDYQDGRRPGTVQFTDAREDALRRDFTINGMFWDPIEEKLYDYVHGQEDLKAGVIRAIGEPNERFNEDKLRLLRAIRFAAKLDFSIAVETRNAIAKRASEVCTVSAERIAQELRKMLMHPNRWAGLKNCMELGMLPYVIYGLTEPGASLATLPPREVSFPVALACVLDAQSLERSEEVCEKLKLSNDETARVVWCLKNRGQLVNFFDLTVERRKTLLAQPSAHEGIEVAQAWLLAHQGCDELSKRILVYLKDLPEGPLDPPPLLGGADLIRLGLRPGPRFTTLLQAIRSAQLNNEISDRTQAMHLVELLIGESERSNSSNSPLSSPGKQ